MKNLNQEYKQKEIDKEELLKSLKLLNHYLKYKNRKFCDRFLQKIIEKID